MLKYKTHKSVLSCRTLRVFGVDSEKLLLVSVYIFWRLKGWHYGNYIHLAIFKAIFVNILILVLAVFKIKTGRNNVKYLQGINCLQVATVGMTEIKNLSLAAPGLVIFQS